MRVRGRTGPALRHGQAAAARNQPHTATVEGRPPLHQVRLDHVPYCPLRSIPVVALWALTGEPTLDLLPDGRWELRHIYRCVVPLVYGRLMRNLKSAPAISGREQRKQLLEDLAAYKQLHGVVLSRLRRELA